MGALLRGSYYSAQGSGWRLARSLSTLAAELDQAHPNVTCLGTKGNAPHQDEGYGSDHNPFVKGPDGLGIVRALDLGGDNAALQAIRAHIWALYFAKFPPLWAYGYSKGTSDNLINNWSSTPSYHVDTGDAGHLHISVTQVNGHYPSPAGYVAAIDSTQPWGFFDPSSHPASASTGSTVSKQDVLDALADPAGIESVLLILAMFASDAANPAFAHSGEGYGRLVQAGREALAESFSPDQQGKIPHGGEGIARIATALTPLIEVLLKPDGLTDRVAAIGADLDRLATPAALEPIVGTSGLSDADVSRIADVLLTKIRSLRSVGTVEGTFT